MVVGKTGPELVAKLLSHFVQYYVEQSAAENHAVREAACGCIAELALKVDRDSVRPFVGKLLETLEVCFRDQSWPVRDGACNACGDFVSVFPTESKTLLPRLMDHWVAHLGDCIWSVREDSAVALGKVIPILDAAQKEEVLLLLRKNLPLATTQPAESHLNARVENVTKFGVADVKRSHDNDEDIHTDRQTYSCGSLAPKLHSGESSDYCYKRDPEPWELSDGAVYLLREMSPLYPKECEGLLPVLSEVSRVSGFAHCFNLWETIWKQLPAIASRLGVTSFSPHWERFAPSLMQTVRTGNRLSLCAAVACVEKMTKILGKEVVSTAFVPSQWDELQRCLAERGAT